MGLKHFKGFTQYFPTVKERPDYADLIEHGVGFEMDSEGRDWYDLRETLQEDTYKVVYMKGGYILQCLQNKNELCPHGCAGLVELEDVPQDLKDGNLAWYLFDGEKLIKNPEFFEHLKQLRLRQASDKVAMYTDLLDLGEDVEEKLQEWREYRRDVYRVDARKLMDKVVWPNAPKE